MKTKQRAIKQQNGPKKKYVNSNDMLKGQVWAVRQELSVSRQRYGHDSLVLNREHTAI